MAAAMASSTGIAGYLHSREELAEQVALRRLEQAAATAKAWRELAPPQPESLWERFERVNGQPLVTACPPRCGCRGAPGLEQVGGR